MIMPSKTLCLINKSAVKQYLLSGAGTQRAYKFTCVSKALLDDIEYLIRLECGKIIRNQPSNGRTIK